MADELEVLRAEMRRRYDELAPVFERVRPHHRLSAANLVDYLTLRHYDLREVQDSLAALGLSSLGRSEEHVITTLERVIDNLHLLAGNEERLQTESAVEFHQGRSILEQNTRALLGPLRPERSTRILVTMPSEAADDYALVEQLMVQGMDCARINCAHDGPEAWTRMVEHLRRAERAVGRPCPILMDLPGPKLRTGPFEPGPRLIRLRPRRDARGLPISPARALLVAWPTNSLEPARASTRLPAIPVAPEFLAALEVGETIALRESRGSKRALAVTAINDTGAEVDAWDTTYLETGTRLLAERGAVSLIGPLAPLEQSVTVSVGDVLTLSADLSPAPVQPRPLEGARNGAAPSARQRVGCTLESIFDVLKVGDRIFFDDGKIGGVVTAVGPREAAVEITAADPAGTKLRAEKGINVPDTELHLPAIGPEDEEFLRFVVDHADVVDLSFCQDASDVVALQEHLASLGGTRLGLVLKIETVRGFNALPELLIAAMASDLVGVMVARGDLAVECGFERLAEVQEEILWLCDAAHVPVIWATQVLDQMTRTGQPSRAEVSDAAMAGRAECVMLNKGPHLGEAVVALDDIIHRMSDHQRKKITLLRRLASWRL